MKPLSADVPLAQSRGPSRGEKGLSLFLLGVLAIITLVIIKVQFAYDPGLWRSQSDDTAAGAAADLAPEAAAALDRSADVAGVQPMSPPEHFGAETLSDKINGKAELYLPSGFRHLESRRLSLTADSSLWIERFVYDMGSYANAFAVYSQQRREGSRALELAHDAYQSANGLFFVQGPFYVEIIGSDTSSAVMDQMAALALAFVDAHPADAVALNESELLPEVDRVADSVTLTAANAFGFEGFDQIYAARYQMGGRDAMAFVSRRASAEEAARLADDYVAFLLAFGGRSLDPPDGAPPVRIVEMFDLVQIVFSKGDLLAGVHEAEALADGLALTERLYRNIGEARQ
jgi:hypothetical protein